MNIYDVSEHAGVSIATVSRVLNGNPNVSEKTREKVLKVMDDLGYTPNVFARGLGLNTMQTIGIMCSDSSDPYLAGAIYYLERGLRSHNYDAILCCTGYDLDAKQKYFELLRSKRVDAIILAGSKFVEMRPKDNAYITEAASELPIMLVNGYLEGDNIYSTVCDDHAAMYGAASQLLKAGRRRILYLYTSYSYSGVNKLEGYKDALKAYGMAPCDELNIIGYNNSILSQCTDPEITSIDSKVEALCTTTINTLMGVFSGVNVPSRTTIASDLIKRKTTNF